MIVGIIIVLLFLWKSGILGAVLNRMIDKGEYKARDKIFKNIYDFNTLGNWEINMSLEGKDANFRKYFDNMQSKCEELYIEIENDNSTFKYLNMSLDEQQEYLNVVDDKIVKEIKKVTEKIYNEVLEDIKKGTINTKVELNPEEYKYYQDIIVQFYDNILANYDGNINDYIYAAFCFISIYINSTTYFYDLIKEVFEKTQLKINIIRKNGTEDYQKIELPYSIDLDDENNLKEMMQTLENINSRCSNFIMSSIIENGYKKVLKDEVSKINLSDDYGKTLVQIYFYNVMLLDVFTFGNMTKTFESQQYFSYSMLTNLCMPSNIVNCLEKDKGIIATGVAGEKRVEDEFKLYEDELKYFPNVRFEEKISVETDGIILSDRGIFSIEIKNYHFDKLIISKDGQWRKCRITQDGEQIEEVIKDVGAQVNNHIIITERLFNKYLDSKGIKEQIEVKPMIIIANDDIIIENNSDMIVARPSQIYPIFKKSNCNYSKQLLDTIEEYIKSNSLESKKYQICDYPKTIKNLLNWCLDNRDTIENLFNRMNLFINKGIQYDIDGFVYKNWEEEKRFYGTGMMSCPNCGAQISIESDFCSECGNKIERTIIKE